MKPLTLPQKNMYETEQFFDGTSMCNIGGLVSFKEYDIDVDLLKKAVNKLIQNSDAIRTVISNENAEPQQYVKEYKHEDVEVIKISSKGCNEMFEMWMKERFVLSQKMYSTKIVKTENKVGVFFKLHHVICDAWGVTIVASKIVEYYYKMLENVEISDDDIPSYFKLIDKEKEYLESSRYEKDEKF